MLRRDVSSFRPRQNRRALLNKPNVDAVGFSDAAMTRKQIHGHALQVASRFRRKKQLAVDLEQLAQLKHGLCCGG